jgi:cold shock CspA family protein
VKPTWRKGEITQWFPLAGFGFCREHGVAGGQDTFLHKHQIVRGVPRIGARVLYQVEERGKRGRPNAQNVEVLEG